MSARSLGYSRNVLGWLQLVEGRQRAGRLWPSGCGHTLNSARFQTQLFRFHSWNRLFYPVLFPIPLVESALLPSAIAGSCDLRTVVNLVFLNHLPFIALF